MLAVPRLFPSVARRIISRLCNSTLCISTLYISTLAIAPFVIAAAPADAQVLGGITVDGNLADWKEIDRIDIRPDTAPVGTRAYAKFAANTLVFGITSPALTTGSFGTVWINSDENAATGYKVFGSTTGAEYNATFSYPSAPILYTNGRGETPVSGALPFAVGANSIEFTIPYASLGSAGTEIQIRLAFDAPGGDAGDIYLPANFFTDRQFTLRASDRPIRVVTAKQVGIVYSASTAAKFFDLKAYSQLFMAAQHQAMMAGIPYDTLSEDDLTDLSKVIQYDALVMPAFNFVNKTKLPAISYALNEAVNRYKVGLITSNDFLTNDETGAAFADPYKLQKDLLGVYPTVSFNAAQPTIFKAVNVTHPSMIGYTNGEVIQNYDLFFSRVFDQAPGNTVTRIVDQQVGASTYGAVLVSETAGRTAHFATERLFGDTNLGWSILRWVVYGNQPQVGLQLTRQTSAFFSRNDMDQSMYPDDFQPVTVGLYSILADWRQKYGFVGTYYLNIGNTPPSETTNWAQARPVYYNYRNLGNELGSHSYTHPDFTSTLTPAQLQFEFQTARTVLQQQLGLLIPGAAVPGNPEPLATSLAIGQYYSYTSGGYSGRGSGYPGAFGYMQPQPSVFYFSPNMTPDFTIIDFKKLTAADAEATWKSEISDIHRHASAPIVHWPWHDYGPTRRFSTVYTKEMYENTIKFARDSGTEFMTGLDIYGRIQSFLAASVAVTSGATISTTVTSSDAGRFALTVVDPAAPTKVINNVGNWYAFNGNKVFLPRAGGTFTTTLGTAPANVTRITSLPMRSTLVSLSGDGQRLTFSVEADGKATLALNPPAGGGLMITGASSYTINGNTAEVTFATYGAYTVTVAPFRCGDGFTATGIETCDDGNTAAGDGCSNTCMIESGFTCSGQPSSCQRAADVTTTFTSIGAEDGWALQYGVGYDLGGFWNASGNGAAAIRIGDDAYKRAYRGILSFDTSSIPDTATILSVSLELTRGTITGTNPFSTLAPASIDIRNGFFGSLAALEANDYQGAATATNVGTLSNGANGSSLAVGLAATANTAVSKTARTQVRLRFNQLTDNDAISDTFGFYSGESTTVAYRPRLRITYRP